MPIAVVDPSPTKKPTLDLTSEPIEQRNLFLEEEPASAAPSFNLFRASRSANLFGAPSSSSSSFREPPSRTARSAAAANKTIDSNSDFNLSSADKKLQIARNRGKKLNQDMGFIGYVGNAEAIADPRNFLEVNASKVVKNHQDCVHGTTSLNLVITPFAGTFKITIASLGDSRAELVLKIRKTNGKIVARQIILTEDHTALAQKAHIEANGGIIVNAGPGKPYYVNDELPMSGGIGDCQSGATFNRATKTFNDCYLRTHEISECLLSDFYNSDQQEELVAAKIIAGSDGLWENQSEDFLAESEKSSDSLSRFSVAPENHAKFVAERARSKGSSDNIIAASAILCEEGTGLVQYDAPVVIGIYDGHIEGERNLNPAPNLNHKYSGDMRDGSITAASAAADFFNLFQTRQDPKVQVVQTDPAQRNPQDIFYRNLCKAAPDKILKDQLERRNS